MSNKPQLCMQCGDDIADTDGLCWWCYACKHGEWDLDDQEPPDDFIDAWDEYSGEYDR